MRDEQQPRAFELTSEQAKADQAFKDLIADLPTKTFTINGHFVSAECGCEICLSVAAEWDAAMNRQN